jgi:flagellin-like hook-associated protein FlgL
VAFSVNTNITSLQAQNTLRMTGDFQSNTIQRVTSGLRIISSGDDAAGLAIANGFRSDIAVLNQGVRNANDGLSTLQTIDGGMSNISKLLDRARTLATQSASDTFTGDRTVLNSEFQSVMSEIDRQSQAVGLNQGGQFARSLSVFIGGGKADASGSNASAITNGSASVDLTTSTVDTQGLGLKGYVAQNTGYDLGTGSTSVATIVADTAANTQAVTGYARFTFAGSGFGDTVGAGALNQNTVNVDVNLNNITDTTTLVNEINKAIANTGNSASANKTAFKNAGVTAKIVTDTTGKQQLAFVSSSSVFQVQAGDKMANALMGNFAATHVGKLTNTANSSLIAEGSQQLMSSGTAVQFTWADFATGDVQTLALTTTDATGSPHSTTINLDDVSGADIDSAIEAINNNIQTQQDSTLAGIVAFKTSTGKIQFASNGSKFQVTVGDNTTAGDGFVAGGALYESDQNGTGVTADISNQATAKLAVAALATAVSTLGQAQAVVGRGQNQFNYAVNLAQSQISNMASAESRIRDADLASEAANLTKAQILMQAGVAALAQANSAPQQILSLLKG